jgi:hypothetical protein
MENSLFMLGKNQPAHEEENEGDYTEKDDDDGDADEDCGGPEQIIIFFYSTRMFPNV